MNHNHVSDLNLILDVSIRNQDMSKLGVCNFLMFVSVLIGNNLLYKNTAVRRNFTTM